MPSSASPQAPRQGASVPPAGGDTSHQPQPVDLGSESAAGEEDPGASIDLAVGVGQQQPPGLSEAGFRPLDRGRVGLVDPNEVAYWCREFGCTEAELRETVARVGDHAGAVREALTH